MQNNTLTSLRLAILKMCIIVYYVTKCDVVKVMLATNKDVELFVYDLKFAGTDEGPELKLAQNAAKLRSGNRAIVNSIVVFEEWEYLGRENHCFSPIRLSIYLHFFHKQKHYLFYKL